MRLEGLRTKIDCAGEDQQQFTRPDPTRSFCLSVCVSPLIFVRRLMISPCRLCVCAFPLNFFVFYEVRIVSKVSRRFLLHRTSCFFIVSTSCGSSTNSPSPANESDLLLQSGSEFAIRLSADLPTKRRQGK
jgi:hypothetical protein